MSAKSGFDVLSQSEIYVSQLYGLNDGTVQNTIIITLAAQRQCEMTTEGRLSEINVAVFMQAGRNNKNKNMDLTSFYVCEDNNAERH